MHCRCAARGKKEEEKAFLAHAQAGRRVFVTFLLYSKLTYSNSKRTLPEHVRRVSLSLRVFLFARRLRSNVQYFKLFLFRILRPWVAGWQEGGYTCTRFSTRMKSRAAGVWNGDRDLFLRSELPSGSCE